MTVINTNVKSLIAQQALTVNNRALSKSMEKLSTGKRINSAADDAAGLSISNKMTAQIRGLNQAVRNANDAISMVQTAEGALNEVTNMLHRMRELAVQSVNGTNSQADRTSLDSEFDQLKAEITRISDKTTWNGMAILGSRATGLFSLSVETAGAYASATDGTYTDVKLTDAGTGTGAGATATITLAGGVPSATNVGGVPTASYAVGDQVGVSADTFGTGVTTTTAVKFKVEEVFKYEFQAGPAASDTLEVNFKDVDSLGGILSAAAKGVDTATGATSAIVELDQAISNVDAYRSTLGAVVNRLNYAADNLTNVSTNTAASRSRILDTDYAATTTELARTQIIQQAATAMLAQANQSPSAVLSLLQN